MASGIIVIPNAHWFCRRQVVNRRWGVSEHSAVVAAHSASPWARRKVRSVVGWILWADLPARAPIDAVGNCHSLTKKAMEGGVCAHDGGRERRYVNNASTAWPVCEHTAADH